MLLEAKNISKSFPGVQALDQVSFSLRAGTVHALMGENGAGKSTLVKCLMGIDSFDSGQMFVQGISCHFHHPRQAIEAGISMIEQELTPVDELTVAENIFLGKEPIKNRFILDYRSLNKKAAGMMSSLELDIDVTTKMKHLSLAEVQLVEIAKALSYESKIIIMDEPTSAIGNKEVETLFRIIQKLKKKGKGIVYVSHRMEEIFTITDEITILRDGKYIDSLVTSEVSQADIIERMVGRKLDDEYLKTNTPGQRVVLSVDKISQKSVVKDISLELREGEILGIFGLMGAGRSEFCDLLFGVRKKDDGRVHLNGREIHIKSPKKAIKNGLAYITEDRKNSGLYLKGTVNHNLCLLILKQLSRWGLLNMKQERERASSMIAQFRIKTPSGEQTVINLSGGNQQKVVLGKWLMQQPDILILDEPTRGIDIGAKREIYQFMSQFASEGKSIIFISSELPEIISMSDRIIVFKDGTKKVELKRGEADQNNVMRYASVSE